MWIPGVAEPLDAVLATPKDGRRQHGLVVMVHGDGPADAARDSFYRPLWETFARAGYASLAWNKPGVDGAPGNWLSQTMHDRAAEVDAVLDWARSRTDIDTSRIGLWGISQGGWVVPEVAAHRSDLQFVILVSPAVNWLRQGEYNLLAELRAAGANDAEIAAALARRAESVRLLLADASYDEYVASGIDDPPMSADRWRFVALNFRADASAALPRVAAPVLLILGGQDRNVDVIETRQVYEQLLPPGRLCVEVFPTASHSLVEARFDQDGSVQAYLVALFAPRSLYASGYLEAMRNFIDRQNVERSSSS